MTIMKSPRRAYLAFLVLTALSGCNASDRSTLPEEVLPLSCEVEDRWVSFDIQDGPDDLDAVWIFGPTGLADYSGPFASALAYRHMIAIDVIDDSQHPAQVYLVIDALRTDGSGTFEVYVGPVPAACLNQLAGVISTFGPNVALWTAPDD